jgi:hypothetical protein
MGLCNASSSKVGAYMTLTCVANRRNGLGLLPSLTTGGNAMEAAASAATPRLQRVLDALATGLAAVGQSALLRRRLAFELQLLAR